MGNKRDNVRELKPRPTKSFQELVAEAVNQKLMTTIDAKINQVAQGLAREQQSTLEDIYSRLSTLEDLVLEQFGKTKDEYAMAVANTQDASRGLTEVGQVQENDVVRLEIATRLSTDAEFKGSSRHQAFYMGSGKSFGKEIEAQIIGMTKNETKEFTFNEKFVAKVKVQRVSRAPAPKAPEVENEHKNA